MYLYDIISSGLWVWLARCESGWTASDERDEWEAHCAKFKHLFAPKRDAFCVALVLKRWAKFQTDRAQWNRITPEGKLPTHAPRQLVYPQCHSRGLRRISVCRRRRWVTTNRRRIWSYDGQFGVPFIQAINGLWDGGVIVWAVCTMLRQTTTTKHGEDIAFIQVLKPWFIISVEAMMQWLGDFPTCLWFPKSHHKQMK